jgi:radical SAM superfamily enzyme YgiQ (UPF0313 family)
LTTLAGHLRQNGWKVLLRDLNVEFYDEVLTPEYLERARGRILIQHEYLHGINSLRAIIREDSLEFQVGMYRWKEMERFLKEEREIFDRISGLILDAKETLRDPRRFYNPPFLVEAFAIIDKALEIISLPYAPARLTFNGFEQPTCPLTVSSIIEHTGTPENNIFYDFLKEKVPALLASGPDLIGISINSFSQLIGGLTLAGMLREQAHGSCHVNIGGNFFTRLREALTRRPEFFEHFCHSVALGPGEKTLLSLVESLSSGSAVSGVPNLLIHEPEGRRVFFTFEEKPEKMENIGLASLEGLPLKKYFTPELVMCIQGSKGCYWGKCSFCDTDFGVNREIKPVERVLVEMRHLERNYGVRHFQFIDESLDPAWGGELADRLISENAGFHWFCNGRTEDAFSRPLLEKLHRAGLSMVLWGFESGNRRIMQLINKGVDFDRRLEVLRNSRDAGIWNFAYIFFGFPTETEEEALETVQAICANKDIIHSYGRSVFTLGKHSKLSVEPEKLGIFEIVYDDEEFSTALSYRSRGGMDDLEIDRMMKTCTRICAGHYAYSLWYYLRYRENIHLYLQRYGRDYVENYRLSDMLAGDFTVC